MLKIKLTQKLLSQPGLGGEVLEFGFSPFFIQHGFAIWSVSELVSAATGREHCDLTLEDLQSHNKNNGAIHYLIDLRHE